MAMVLWMMSPSQRAEVESRTLSPRSRPVTRPCTITSSAITSPLTVALSPTTRVWARMSPSTMPSIWMSPLVSTLPWIVRSDDSTEAAGFGRAAAIGAGVGATLAVVGRPSNEGAVVAESGGTGIGASGSFGLVLLENILRGLQVGHRILRLAVDPNLVVEVRACATPG